MAQVFPEITKAIADFIDKQKMFFVATAASDGTVNLSPKGMDSFRILAPNRVLWLNITGSGNETAAHLLENPRMTIMFCAFEGDPLILRLYGQARAIHHLDDEWSEFYAHFGKGLAGARQIFELIVDRVQTSCGQGVPLYDYVGDRDQLIQFAERKGESGLKDYWKQKNHRSIDGKPTHIIEKNIPINERD